MFDLELLEHSPTHRAAASLDNAARSWMQSVIELLQARDYEHMVNLSVKDDQTRVLLTAATTSVLARGLGESKRFFAAVRSLGRRKAKAFSMVRTDNGHTATTPKEARETWMTHVSKRVGGTPVSLGAHFQDNWDRRRGALDAPLSLIDSADALANEILALPPDRATGSDGIPIRAVRATLGQFADRFFPLYAKVQCWRHVPVRFLGGVCQELYKGFEKGSIEDPKAYRTVVMEDHLAKLLPRPLRRALVSIWTKNGGAHQAGMRPGAGVEFAQLALDTFGHWCRKERSAGGALFVDVSAAFDTVLHQLLFETQLAPPAIADLLRTLGVHNKYIDMILDRVATLKPILAAANVPDDLAEITASFIAGAWYSVEGVELVLPLIRGSRPGNSIAYVLFEHTSAALLGELNTEMTRRDLAVCLPSCDSPLWFHDHLTIERHLGDETYVDDTMVPTAASSFEAPFGDLRNIIQLVCHTYNKYGLSLSAGPGKTAYMVFCPQVSNGR